MEVDKRKSPDDDEVVQKRPKAEKDDGITTVTEDEVEEFFAILRRIQVAANYFKRRDGCVNGRKLTAEEWKPMICEMKDGEDGVKDQSKSTDQDSAESSTGLDLNLEPLSE